MNKWINKEDACQVAEPYGAFQNADAQGDVRHQFANNIIERHERIRNAAPDLLAALKSIWDWMEAQADSQSKGGHAAFDLLMLREQRDIAEAAITRAEGGAA